MPTIRARRLPAAGRAHARHERAGAAGLSGAPRDRIPVIIITGHGDVSMAVKAMKVGAVDFIEKPFDDEELLVSIRNALQHDEKQRALRAQRADIAARMAELTPREHEVMSMVTDGKSNKEIAAALGVSAKTVEVHRARVMDKMRADSLAELVRMAMIAGGYVPHIPRVVAYAVSALCPELGHPNKRARINSCCPVAAIPVRSPIDSFW
jgi:RNA polymerase sigma factor (sigma-70 family)